MWVHPSIPDRPLLYRNGGRVGEIASSATAIHSLSPHVLLVVVH